LVIGADFLPRLCSALVLGPLVLVLAWLGGWPFAVLLAAIAVLVWREWVVMSGIAPSVPALALGGAAILTAMAALASGAAPAGLVALILGLAAVALVAQPRCWALSGLLYAAVAGLAPLLLRGDPQIGLAAIFWLIAVVWATDIAAYFCGRLLGGPRLWPRVSPNKTWSGAIGGALFGTLAGVLVARAFGIEATLGLALVSLVASAVSQGGDLFESAMKRHFHVKDSGALIPGHGGLMDRLDGLIAAAAFAVLVGLARNPLAVGQGLLLW